MTASLPVGYIMTHYPRNAQTFIAGEIDAVERDGIAVTPFAMNRPDARELAVPGATDRAGRTRYLKDAPLSAVGDLLRVALRHPLGTARIARAAIASAGGSPTRIARRLAHLVQAARVARIARSTGLRHLHAHFGLAPATIAWLASALLSLEDPRVGFSFTIHGFHDFADPAETRLDVKGAAADAIVCVSDFTRSQLFLNSDPAVWPRAHVIRCGIDLVRWDYAPRKRDGVPGIVATGRLSAEKGFTILIEAVALMRDAGVDATLTLVGDGPERGAIEAAVVRLNLADRVSLAGELSPPDVRAALRSADIFCLPSFSEGLPVSIMEAMASGIPTVATWISGIPELAENGVTAMTVPPARADALADALTHLVRSPDIAAAIARDARVRVEAMHSQDINGRAMADLFRKLAA